MVGDGGVGADDEGSGGRGCVAADSFKDVGEAGTLLISDVVVTDTRKEDKYEQQQLNQERLHNR